MRITLLFALLYFSATTNHIFPAETTKKTLVDSLLTQIQNTRSDSAKARLMIALARQYSKTDFKPAMEYADQAVQFAEKSKSPALLIDALNKSGDIYLTAGLYDIAAQLMLKSYELTKKSGTDLDRIISYINLGAIYLSTREYEKSQKYLLDALTAAKQWQSKNNDSILPMQAINILNNLSIISREKGDLIKALEFNEQAIQLCRQYPTVKRTLSKLLNSRADILIRLEKYDQSLGLLKESIQLKYRLGDSLQIASPLHNLGRLHLAQGKYREAQKELTKALGLAISVNDLAMTTNIYYALSELYRKTGMADSALKYLTLSQETEKKVKVEEASREMLKQELLEQYKIREDMEKNQHTHSINRAYMVIAAALVLIAAIIFIYWRTHRRYKKTNLEKMNLELASQKHDLEKELFTIQLEQKDKQLTTNVMYAIQKNEIISGVVEKLMKHQRQLNDPDREIIKEVISDLEKSRVDKTWEEFELRFQQVHSGFHERLQRLNPDLTQNERRLCAFLRLDMTTKEISAITGQTTRSIEMARIRLRKKLGLSNTDRSLTNYLSSL